jgi:hypothetical protein
MANRVGLDGPGSLVAPSEPFEPAVALDADDLRERSQGDGRVLFVRRLR